MRDPERIGDILEVLGDIWARYPDLRFWQLLSIIDWDYKGDFFYLEDNKTYEALVKTYKEGF